MLSFSTAAVKGLPQDQHELFISSLNSILLKSEYDLAGFLPVQFGRHDSLGLLSLIQLISGYILMWKAGLMQKAMNVQVRTICQYIL